MEYLVESLERFAQNQRIIEEFAWRCLANVVTDLGRLHYVATLRDVSTGRYHHYALAEIYSEAAIHQALLYCHEEPVRQTFGKNAARTGVGPADHVFRN